MDSNLDNFQLSQEFTLRAQWRIRNDLFRRALRVYMNRVKVQLSAHRALPARSYYGGLKNWHIVLHEIGQTIMARGGGSVGMTCAGNRVYISLCSSVAFDVQHFSRYDCGGPLSV